MAAEDRLAEDVEDLVLRVVLVHGDLLEHDLALLLELEPSNAGRQTMSAMTSKARSSGGRGRASRRGRLLAGARR
jgi:hypothetical protein